MSKRTEEFFDKVYAAADAEAQQAVYDAWASQYDAAMVETGYASPPILAAMLKKALGGASGRVIDIGCGTGLGGEALRQAGFRTIDGIDLSPDMLAAAAAKSIYRNLVQADLMANPEFPDSGYEAAYAAGVFTLGHLGPDAVPTVMRALGPAGVFALTVADHAWSEQGWDGALAALEGGYVADCIAHEYDDHVKGHDLRAHFLLLRKPE